MNIMNPITQSEMNLIMAQQNALLDLPCLVERKTLTSDGVGTSTESWTTVYSAWSVGNPSGLKCGMQQPSTTQLTALASRFAGLAVYNVRFPNTTVLRNQDRLTVAGEKLIVQMEATPQSWSTLLTVLATELKAV